MLVLTLLTSLTLMGVSRKVFGQEAVARRLVPHRADIGVAAFFTIGVAACVELGFVDATWAPGGQYHLMAAAFSQLGYLASLLSRGDLPPTHPHRLALLIVVWAGLATGGAHVQIVVETASLWIVKLRVGDDLAPQQRVTTDEPSAALVAAVEAAPASSAPVRPNASPARPNASPAPRRASKSPARARKKQTYRADANNDGTTTRSEARAVNLSVSAADVNDDGRVTRSEARLAASNTYRKRLA
jgi:hypothetical protein